MIQSEQHPATSNSTVAQASSRLERRRRSRPSCTAASRASRRAETPRPRQYWRRRGTSASRPKAMTPIDTSAATVPFPGYQCPGADQQQQAVNVEELLYQDTAGRPRLAPSC